MYRARAYGFVVEADLVLPLPVADDSTAADLTIVADPAPLDLAWNPPARDLLCQDYDELTGRGHLGARLGDGYRLRLPGLCEFDLDESLSTVRWRAAPGAEPTLLPLVSAGILLAYWLCLRGTLVLHASAVSLNGRGLAFLGRSGMGKSTMAAAMCASGALLVTDDVAAVEFHGERAFIASGAGDVRLRQSPEQARDLAGPGAPQPRETADERRALAFPAVSDTALPLAAAVFVHPVHDQSFELRRLAGGEALAALNESARITGLTDLDLSARQFGQCADLLEHVQVYTVRIPWTPDGWKAAAAALRPLVSPVNEAPGAAAAVARVVVADRRALVRDSVARMLARQAGVEVVEVVCDAADVNSNLAPTLLVRGEADGLAPAGLAEHRFGGDDSFDGIRRAVLEGEARRGAYPVDAPADAVSESSDRLTAREQQVVRALADGLTTREIAVALGMAPKSVDNHRQHIFAKLGVQSASAAVRAAQQAGLLTSAYEPGAER